MLTMRGMRATVPAVLIAAGLAILVGCGGKPGEKAAEKAAAKAIESGGGGKADVNMEKGKVTVKTDAGQTEIAYGATSWPEDMPAGVPKLMGGKVKAVTRSDQDGKKGWNVVVEDVEGSALEKYAGQLKEAGWTIMTQMAAPKGGMVQATKDELHVIAMFNDEKKVASIGVSYQ
jgi:hypothetical protein